MKKEQLTIGTDGEKTQNEPMRRHQKEIISFILSSDLITINVDFAMRNDRLRTVHAKMYNAQFRFSTHSFYISDAINEIRSVLSLTLDLNGCDKCSTALLASSGHRNPSLSDHFAFL